MIGAEVKRSVKPIPTLTDIQTHKIYCTVSTQDKIDFISHTYGIKVDHIFNSRDANFVSGIIARTQGRGVDVVLNSLSGELLHASWKCVAEFGIMVEIGRRDFIGNGQLDMGMFDGNRTFVGFDLSKVAAKKQAIMTRSEYPLESKELYSNEMIVSWDAP